MRPILSKTVHVGNDGIGLCMLTHTVYAESSRMVKPCVQAVYITSREGMLRKARSGILIGGRRMSDEAHSIARS